MSNFATGKKSKAISDRSGMTFPYKEMRKEWNGLFVHTSEYEAKHPQLEQKHKKVISRVYKMLDLTGKKIQLQICWD